MGKYLSSRSAQHFVTIDKKADNEVKIKNGEKASEKETWAQDKEGLVKPTYSGLTATVQYTKDGFADDFKWSNGTIWTRIVAADTVQQGAAEKTLCRRRLSNSKRLVVETLFVLGRGERTHPRHHHTAMLKHKLRRRRLSYSKRLVVETLLVLKRGRDTAKSRRGKQPKAGWRRARKSTSLSKDEQRKPLLQLLNGQKQRPCLRWRGTKKRTRKLWHKKLLAVQKCFLMLGVVAEDGVGEGAGLAVVNET